LREKKIKKEKLIGKARTDKDWKMRTGNPKKERCGVESVKRG